MLRSFINDLRVHSILIQTITVVAVGAVVWLLVNNVAGNLTRANTASGFGFLNGRAGFDIGDKLFAFTTDSNYAQALLVGLGNTLLVAFLGIVTATILGFAIGLGRLSNNWLIARLCGIYVEVFRNLPVLLVIFFWYIGVLRALPSVKDSLQLPFDIFVNNRGLQFPKPLWDETAWLVVLAFLAAVVLSIGIALWSSARQRLTGQRLPVLWINVALLIGLPMATFLALGSPVDFDVPVAGRFNLSGGATISPEFFALYLSLSFYTATFIAEIVRAGINGVAKGQREAASALGLRPGLVSRLVVIPQAARMIIPPLTSQFLTLTKNSSLGVAIGYPELVSVGGTIMSQTGQAVEIVVIWMLIYLGLSLTTSLFMNWFNAKMALVER